MYKLVDNLLVEVALALMTGLVIDVALIYVLMTARRSGKLSRSSLGPAIAAAATALGSVLAFFLVKGNVLGDSARILDMRFYIVLLAVTMPGVVYFAYWFREIRRRQREARRDMI